MAVKCPPLCDGLKSDLEGGLVHFLLGDLAPARLARPGRTMAVKCPPLCDGLKSDLEGGLVHFLLGQTSQAGQPSPAQPAL